MAGNFDTDYLGMASRTLDSFISKDGTIDVFNNNISRTAIPSTAQIPELQPKTKQSTFAAAKLGSTVFDLTQYQTYNQQKNDKMLQVTMQAGTFDHSAYFRDARNVDATSFQGSRTYIFLVPNELAEEVDINWEETDMFKIASGLIGSAGQGAVEAVQSAKGFVDDMIINPYNRMKFTGVKPRMYGFSVYFYPKNKLDTDKVKNAIVDLKNSILPNVSGAFLVPPLIFRLTIGGENAPLNKEIIVPGLCAVTKISINYTPLDQKATFFENWSPKAIKMDISLSEITPIYSKAASGGYSQSGVSTDKEAMSAALGASKINN